ncbi:GNAT family N-acetyltransferase [Novosphingobium silvae]|uniref:GNAT family N-acetyltransferase n=1 Tax=Novosphingobium silvae TaxID=2692619 RepID=UPI00301BFA94
MIGDTGPILTTRRFDLWRPSAHDLEGLCRLLADEETRRFLGPARAEPHAQFDRLMRNAGSWALRGYGTFIVRPRGEGEIVGTCGIFHSYRGFGAALGLDDVPEAGWIVRHDHHGQGVAREVMDAALAWFDAAHGPRRIACMIEEGNLPSRRLAERLGFTHYATHELEEGDEKVPLLLLERVAR